MILPTKHVRPDRALIGVGAEVLEFLEAADDNVAPLDEVRGRRSLHAPYAPIFRSTCFTRSVRSTSTVAWCGGLHQSTSIWSDLALEDPRLRRPACTSAGRQERRRQRPPSPVTDSGCSFVELVHFLFGADARKESIFRSDALVEWTFDVAVDVAGEEISAARSGAKPSRLLINGPVETWPIPPQFDGIGLYDLSNEGWKANLGKLWFGLPISAGDEAERFQPSFGLESSISRDAS